MMNEQCCCGVSGGERMLALCLHIDRAASNCGAQLCMVNNQYDRNSVTAVYNDCRTIISTGVHTKWSAAALE
eukprot:21199-Heterococcus_DN1.PRE.1